MNYKNILNTLTLLLCIIAIGLFIYLQILPLQPVKKTNDLPGEVIENKISLNEFGFYSDNLIQIDSEVKRNETFSTILNKFSLGKYSQTEVIDISRKYLDLRKIISGNKYHAYLSTDSTESLKYFVYELNPVDYVVISLNDSLYTYSDSRELKIKRKEFAGIINSSLYETLNNKNINIELAIKLSEIFAWQIDFYRIQKGDNFKVIYEEKYVNDNSVGIGKIYGAYFKHSGDEYYAIEFDQNDKEQYFDENGKSLRKAFLKAPIKFSRISSRFSRKRFHPVQKVWKAHLGTDYAAPTGTPIWAVGDGVVTEARYSRFNGNYVKIRHNGTYSTQYLHMSKFAKGIRKGVRVQQGQVIGYVGSTGLATGPHVCFRFWKNGSQVNPLREKIPPSKPIDSKYFDEFMKVKSLILTELDKIQLNGLEDKNVSVSVL